MGLIYRNYVNVSQIILGLTPSPIIDFQKHFERLQKVLSEEYAPGRNSIDRIDEETWWNKIIKVLNDISSKSAES